MKNLRNYIYNQNNLYNGTICETDFGEYHSMSNIANRIISDQNRNKEYKKYAAIKNNKLSGGNTNE